MSRSGTNESFEALYEGVAGAVYAWASLHLRPELRTQLEPEDVLQEVCCRAYARFEEYDPARAPFRSWFFGIAHNVLREAFRNLARSRVRTGQPFQTSGQELGTGWVDSLPDTATSITTRVARDDQLKAFLRRVGLLPEEDRKLLIYRGLEGLEHSHVGELMDLTPESASKRWQRLRARLRDVGMPDDLAAA